MHPWIRETRALTCGGGAADAYTAATRLEGDVGGQRQFGRGLDGVEKLADLLADKDQRAVALASPEGQEVDEDHLNLLRLNCHALIGAEEGAHHVGICT